MKRFLKLPRPRARRLGLIVLSSAAAAALVGACAGGEADVVVSGPGPGRDEVPFPQVPGDGDPFSGTCESLVTCESLSITCGQVLDNCGQPLVCDNNEQDGNETDIDCGGGDSCDRLCQQGQVCEEGTDCQSGFCVDGVCCDQECTGECLTCASGFCNSVGYLEEDPDTCTSPNLCDGDGACKAGPGEDCVAGSDCASGSCDTVAGTCN
jgi:hypothetical protein